jgi:hypothetical protein
MKRRVVACGVRFGKSIIGAHECVAALLEPRESGRGWLCAPIYDLTSRIFKRVVEILHVHAREELRRADAHDRSGTGGGVTELRPRVPTSLCRS